MKKKILLPFLVSIVFSLNLFSQMDLKYGLKAGVQKSGVPEMHAFSSKKTGGSFGAFATYPLDEKGRFNIQAELLYSMQGEYGKKENGSGDKIDFGQDYLAIPVLFKLNLFDFHSTSNFFVEAGPQFSFLANQKSPKVDEADYGKPNSFDFAIALGLGYRFQGQYELGARYNWGLSDVYKDYPAQANAGVKKISPTRVAGLYAAYIF